MKLTKTFDPTLRQKRQERILSYDPDQMRLNWISTGLRRKPGSMLAKVNETASERGRFARISAGASMKEACSISLLCALSRWASTRSFQEHNANIQQNQQRQQC